MLSVVSKMSKKFLVLGSSRGLGQALVQLIPKNFNLSGPVWEVSRKLSPGPHRQILDLSKPQDQSVVCELVAQENFDVVIYAAGGGPHGDFSKKQWKDHEWAFEVGLVAPLRICHSWLVARRASVNPGCFVFVGSRIAENAPDPLAASYAAGKHGLRGFASSVQEELKGGSSQVRLFSPGYMDTDLLPNTASVRQDGSQILDPNAVAQELLNWLKNPGPWHLEI